VTWAGMNRVCDAQLAAFRAAYPGAPKPTTVRNHHVLWCGLSASGGQEFTAQAQIELKRGIGTDFNYVYNRTQGTGGYGIPSGLPMRFATSTGEVLDIFQADTQLEDDVLTAKMYTNYQNLLDASLTQGKYAWVVVNYHPGAWPKYSDQGRQTLDLAVANGIPIWSGAQMNSFVRMRDAVQLEDVRWKRGILSFFVKSSAANRGDLTLMAPMVLGSHTLEKIRIAGVEASHVVQRIAGSDYALFTIKGGIRPVDAIYVPKP